MSWARIRAADGSGHCAVREVDAALQALSFEGTHARMTTRTEAGSPGAWRLRIWLSPSAFEEELDIETHEPDAIFAVTTLYVLSEVGDEHAGWVRDTVLSALRRLVRVQAGPLLYCSDDTLARLAAQAELRLRAEAAEAWPDLAHTRSSHASSA